MLMGGNEPAIMYILDMISAKLSLGFCWLLYCNARQCGMLNQSVLLVPPETALACACWWLSAHTRAYAPALWSAAAGACEQLCVAPAEFWPCAAPAPAPLALWAAASTWMFPHVVSRISPHPVRCNQTQFAPPGPCKMPWAQSRVGDCDLSACRSKSEHGWGCK